MAKFPGWQAKQKRYIRKLNGAIKSRSYNQLKKDYPELVTGCTYEGTVKAARKWWTKLTSEVEAEPKPGQWQDRFQDALKMIEQRRDYYRENEDELGVALNEMLLKKIKPIMELSQQPSDEVLKPLAQDYWHAEWNKRLTPPDKNDSLITQRMTEYIATQQKRRGKQGSAGLSRGGLENKIRYIRFAENIVGNDYVSKINEKTVSDVCSAIDEMGGSETTRNGYKVGFMEFLGWMYENKILDELPRNYRSKSLSYTPKKKKPDPPVKEDVQYLIQKLREHNKEKLELFCLFHLNCGAYMSDIGQFTIGQLNEKKRTITYSRKKTENHEIEGATYILWDRTYELLKKFKNKSRKKSDLLFVNKNGTSITLGENDSRKDVVGKAFRKFGKEHATGYKYSMMDLRKASATFLQNLEYPDCVRTFNQRSGRNTDENWYLGDIFEVRFFEGLKAVEEYLEL